MLWRLPSRWFVQTLLVSSCVACAASGFDGQTYRAGDLRFRVGEIPSRWRRLEVEGALLAFRDDAANATVALNGRCKVDGDDVPLESLTQHLFLQFTDRTLQSQSRVSLDGREALCTELTGALDGVAKKYLVYVLKKDGCVYDFMYIAAVASAGPPAEFTRFVQGFATLR